jgi:hypothetical protein
VCKVVVPTISVYFLEHKMTKKLSIKKVVSVERKVSTGCPSANTSSCGNNYRGS